MSVGVEVGKGIIHYIGIQIERLRIVQLRIRYWFVLR